MNDQVFMALKDVNNLRILAFEKGEYVVDRRRTVLERLRRTDEYFERDFYIQLKIHALRRLIGKFPRVSKRLGLKMLMSSLDKDQVDAGESPIDEQPAGRDTGLTELQSLGVSEELVIDPRFREAVKSLEDMQKPLAVAGFISYWQRALRRQKSRIINDLNFDSSITDILELCRHDPSVIIAAQRSVRERAPHATTFKAATRSIHSRIHRFTKQNKNLSRAVRGGFKLLLLWDPRDQVAVIDEKAKTLHGVVFIGRLPRGSYPPNYLKVSENLSDEEGFKLIEEEITKLEKNLNRKEKNKSKPKLKIRFRVCDLHRLGARLRALSKGQGIYDVELLDDSLALTVYSPSPLKRGKCEPLLEIVRKDLCAAYYAHAHLRGCLAYLINRYEDSFPSSERG